jgi:hypothetical protein
MILKLIPLMIAVLMTIAPGAARSSDVLRPGVFQSVMAEVPQAPIVLAQSGCGHAVQAVRSKTGISGRVVGTEMSGGRVMCVVLIFRPKAGGSQAPVAEKHRVPAQ